jgi:MerR family transcriptional regulator/heat shock protein HspR
MSEDDDIMATERDVTTDDGAGGGEAAGVDVSAPALAGQGRPGPRRGGKLSQITADRPIFTLSVAADLLGLHPRTLRIYEEKKLVVPARTEGNRRRYSQNDIQRFQFIRRLTRGGVNLEGVRIILDMADELTQLGGDAEAVIERNLQALDEW